MNLAKSAVRRLSSEFLSSEFLYCEFLSREFAGLDFRGDHVGECIRIFPTWSSCQCWLTEPALLDPRNSD